MSNAAAIAIRDGPIRAAIVFEFAMDCLPARCRCGTSTDKNTHREEPVRRSAAPVRHRPTAVGNEPKRNARRPCTITQRLGAEEGDTPVEQQPAAMQEFDPTYDRCGSLATEEVEAARSSMSALPPKADEWIDASVCQLCASSDRMHRKCYFVPTATRRSVGTITVPSLCSNRRITVSISFHTASRSASLIRSRNGRISGSEFPPVLHGRGNRGEALGAWHDFHRHVTEAGTLESASKHGGIAQREHSRVFEGRRRQP